jgi:serine kinase of HPr protein (carbohydrate metabolism regulator)
MTQNYMPISFLYEDNVAYATLQDDCLYVGDYVVYQLVIEHRDFSKSFNLPFVSNVTIEMDGITKDFPIEKVLLACLTEKKFTSKKTSSTKIRKMFQQQVVGKIMNQSKSFLNLHYHNTL